MHNNLTTLTVLIDFAYTEITGESTPVPSKWIDEEVTTLPIIISGIVGISAGGVLWYAGTDTKTLTAIDQNSDPDIIISNGILIYIAQQW